VVILLFAWLVFLQTPTLDPARGYGGANPPAPTPYIVFVRDPADFPITVTPAHTTATTTTGSTQLPGWLAPAIVVAIISAVASLAVSYLDRRSKRPQIVNEINLGRDEFLLKKVAAVEADNRRLEARVSQLEQESDQKDRTIARQAMENERLRAMLAKQGA
jgi:hypothetical protein